MANHLRRQIREAVATAVTGLATTGSRVFPSRVYPLAETELPALTVVTRSDAVEAPTMGFPRILERRLRLEVTAHAQGTADVDDTLDQICKEVEIALANPVAALAGLANTITLQSTEIGLDGGAAQPEGQAAMVFEVYYLSAENAPDVAL